MKKETMLKIKDGLIEAGRDFANETINNTRLSINDAIQEAVMEERANQEQLVAYALVESGLSDECVIRMLQKYWDKRESEARKMIAQARRCISRQGSVD